MAVSTARYCEAFICIGAQFTVARKEPQGSKPSALRYRVRCALERELESKLI